MGLTALLPVALPLIVKLVEKIFPSKSGVSQKLPAAQEFLKTLINMFSAPGVGLPGAEEQKIMIQQVVDALNKSGELKGAATALAPSGVDQELFAMSQSVISNGLALQARALKGVA